MTETGSSAVGRWLQMPFVRIPLKLVAALIVLAAGLFAIVAIYNSFDEELSAEAKALLAPPQLGRIDDQNGFVAMIGMRAPLGEDQMAWGLKVAEAYAAQARPGFVRTPEWHDSVKPRLGATKEAAWCRPSERDCLAFAKERAADLAGVLADERNAETLKRYRKVRELPAFTEINIGPDPGAIIPFGGEIAAGTNLSRLDIALRVHRGDLEGAVTELEREAAFQRRMMAQGSWIISTMVGNAMLAENLLVVSDLLRSGGERVAPYRARLAALAMAPIDTRAISTAVRTDLHMGLLLFHSEIAQSTWINLVTPEMSPLPTWSLSYLFRRNETANVLAKLATIEIGIAEASAADFDARVKAREAERRALPVRPWYAGLLYNPVGEVLAGTFGFEASQYVGRMHDLVALSRMVGLQGALAERGITEPAAIAAFVAGEGAKSYNDPYTGEPFSFDPATRLLSFAPRANSQWSQRLRKRHAGMAIII